MDQRQVDLVRASFAQLPQDAEAVGMLFYSLLFKIDPELRPLFRGDMQRQSELLVTMIATAVENLDRLDLVLSAVRDLGRRHAGYGVKEVDYDTVETALLLTLAQALGGEFTPEVRQAWIACYRTLAEVMKTAATRAAPARRRRRDSAGISRAEQFGEGGAGFKQFAADFFERGPPVRVHECPAWSVGGAAGAPAAPEAGRSTADRGRRHRAETASACRSAQRGRRVAPHHPRPVKPAISAPRGSCTRPDRGTARICRSSRMSSGR